jgi:hypothetical protein
MEVARVYLPIKVLVDQYLHFPAKSMNFMWNMKKQPGKSLIQTGQTSPRTGIPYEGSTAVSKIHTFCGLGLYPISDLKELFLIDVSIII